MAWLDVTPDKSKLPRRTKLQLRERKGEYVPELNAPELDFSLEYLVDYLFQIGPTMGEGPLTFQEMSAWCSISGAKLDDFEGAALRNMSIAYLSMAHAARNPDCPCPAAPQNDDGPEGEMEDERRKRVNDAMRKGFGAMADAPQKKGIVRKGKR